MNADKPMLAGHAPKNLAELEFPVLVSPKYDGIRARVIGGRVLSRNNLELPNENVQRLFGQAKYNGFDGEIIVGDPTAQNAYNLTQSVVMSDSHSHEHIRFYVFDDITHPEQGFRVRLDTVKHRIIDAGRRSYVENVVHQRAVNVQAVELYDEMNVQEGYEGTMIRHPGGPYKSGRSTTKQGWLLKLKRFEDDEAVIIGFKEMMHNDNTERTGGVANRRSSKKAGLRGANMLGAFIVHNPKTNETFDVGTGFTLAERMSFWKIRNALIGKLIRYKYFPHGVKDAPRHPVFGGFRHLSDL